MGCAKKTCLNLPLLVGFGLLILVELINLGLLIDYPGKFSIFIVKPGESVGFQQYATGTVVLAITGLGLYGIVVSNRRYVWWFCLLALGLILYLLVTQSTMPINPHKMTKEKLLEGMNKTMHQLPSADDLSKLKGNLFGALKKVKNSNINIVEAVEERFDDILRVCCGFDYASRKMCNWESSSNNVLCTPLYSKVYKLNKLAYLIFGIVLGVVLVLSFIFVLLTPRKETIMEDEITYEVEIDLGVPIVPTAPTPAHNYSSNQL